MVNSSLGSPSTQNSTDRHTLSTQARLQIRDKILATKGKQIPLRPPARCPYKKRRRLKQHCSHKAPSNSSTSTFTITESSEGKRVARPKYYPEDPNNFESRKKKYKVTCDLWKNPRPMARTTGFPRCHRLPKPSGNPKPSKYPQPSGQPEPSGYPEQNRYPEPSENLEPSGHCASAACSTDDCTPLTSCINCTTDHIKYMRKLRKRRLCNMRRRREYRLRRYPCRSSSSCVTFTGCTPSIHRKHPRRKPCTVGPPKRRVCAEDRCSFAGSDRRKPPRRPPTKCRPCSPRDSGPCPPRHYYPRPCPPRKCPPSLRPQPRCVRRSCSPYRCPTRRCSRSPCPVRCSRSCSARSCSPCPARSNESLFCPSVRRPPCSPYRRPHARCDFDARIRRLRRKQRRACAERLLGCARTCYKRRKCRDVARQMARRIRRKDKKFYCLCFDKACVAVAVWQLNTSGQALKQRRPPAFQDRGRKPEPGRPKRKIKNTRDLMRRLRLTSDQPACEQLG